MKSHKRFLSILLASALALSPLQMAYAYPADSQSGAAGSAGSEDYTQYVDPFVGTQVDYGQLFPGSVVPYGLMKLNADTYPHNTLDHAGYDYSKGQIEGFTHTRVEGVGGQGSGGDILVTPTYAHYTEKPSAASRAMQIVKDKYGNKIEDASPGYYTVSLWPKKGMDDAAREDRSAGSIKAELTSDVRTGYHRYTLPKDGEISLTVDMKYTYHPRSRDVILNIEKGKDKTALSGRFSGTNVSGNGKYTMYFYMETSQPALDVDIWDAEGFRAFSGKTVTGDDVGAVLTFMGKKGVPLEVKVSVSPISAEQAKKDMEAEMPGWDFEKERAEAKQAWNEVLGKVKVTASKTSDPDGTKKRLFYTHLYHMFTMPMNATSTDGTYRDISPDNNVKVADGYTHYDSWTLWDDFKKYPIIGLVLPDVYADIIRSVADGLEAGFATWSHNYQVVPNIRTEHAVALLADGVSKGMTDIPNLDAAYEKAKEIADKVTDADRRSRADRMVEYCYDDWAISQLAQVLYEQTGDGKYMEDYQKYATRAFLYKELYRADAVIPAAQYQGMTGMGENPVGSAPMGLLWGKNADGTWRSGNPESIGSGQGLYQGSLWQYTFWDTNDVAGLMDLMGGKDAMYRQLSYLMGEYDPENGSRMLHTSDNEIDMHSPYLFNYVGRPSRTQYWTRQIYGDKSFTCGYTGAGGSKQYLYKLQPAGYLEGMDDDAGTMASAYVAAATGLFPVTPGDPTFQITSPFFEEIRLDVGNGKEFVIQADNVSPDNKYIQSATLNGAEFERTWLDYEEISRGGTIRYEMDSEPSDWAAEAAPVPSMSDTVDSSIYENEPISFSSMAFLESEENDGSIQDSIQIVLQDEAVSFQGEDGKDVAPSSYSVANVPQGLQAKLVKEDGRTLRLSLAGKAEKHGISDNIDSLSLELKDSLFSGTVTSKRKSQMLKVQFNDNGIRYSKDTVKEGEDGAFNETVVASLTGDVAFSGNNGEDFVESGKLTFQGLPQGMELAAVKTGNRQVELRFTGRITGKLEDRDGLKLTFSDSAFVGDKADCIIGANYGGMKTIRILSASASQRAEREAAVERLKMALEQCKKTDFSIYLAESVQALERVMEKAEALLEEEASITTEQAESMGKELEDALNSMAKRRDGTKKIELEDFDTWSSLLHPDSNNNGPLKVENTSDPEEAVKTQQVANTFRGAWLSYGVDFGDEAPDTLSIRYSGSQSCYPDSAVELRLGGVDGEAVVTVPTPPTGAWANYTTATVELTEEAKEKLAGEKSLYLVFTGTHISNNKYYAGNFNWMQFQKKDTQEPEKIHDVSGGKLLEAENFDSWDTTRHPSGNGPLKTESAGAGGSGQSVANTFDKAWIKFDKIDFGSDAVTKITANYKMKKANCPEDSRLEIRKDDPENGELLATVMLPEVEITSGNWSPWVLAEAEIEGGSLKGVMDNIYMVFRGDMSGHNSWYICNLDYLKFESVKKQPAYERIELEDYLVSGDGLQAEDKDGGKVVANVNSGEGILVPNVDFGEDAPEAITVRYAANTNCHKDAHFEIRLGAKDGELVSKVSTPITGGWDQNAQIRVELDAEGRKKLTGSQDIYILFGGSGGSWVGNFNWIRFERFLTSPVAEKEYGLLQAEEAEELSADCSIENADYVSANASGAWLRFDKCQFTGEGLGKVSISYSQDSSSMGKNTKAEIYLDSKDKERPDAVIDLPATSSGSDLYQTATVKLDPPVTGEHTLYLVLKTEASGNSQKAAKLDWLLLQEANAYLEQLETLYGTLSPAKNKIDIQQQLEQLFLPLREALLKAERLIGSNAADREEIAEAAKALAALEQPIVECLLGGEMGALIQETEKLNAQNTDAESLAAIQPLLVAAKAVQADSGYAEYAAAYDALKQAYDTRKPTQDKYALAALLAEAREAQNSTGEYLTESKKFLASAIDQAEAAMAEEKATEELITAAMQGLKDAMGALVPVADKAGLEQAVAQAQELLLQGGLLDAAKQLVEEKVNAAKALIDRASSDMAPTTSREFSIGKKELEDALAWAKSLPDAGQKAAFDQLKDEATNMDLKLYTSSSARALREALKAAEALGEYPSADEMLEAMEALQAAMAGLEADRSALLYGMSQAEIFLLQAGRYTEDSLQSLEAVLEQAKAIYDKEDASIAEVEEAAKSLESAMKGLVSVHSLLVSKGSGSGFYAENATVTVAADQPSEGQRFVKWQAEGITLADASQEKLQFTMPANGVTLTAIYEEIPSATVTDPDSGIQVSGKITSQAGFTVKAFTGKDAGYTEMKGFLGGQEVIGAYTLSGLAFDGKLAITFPTGTKWNGKMVTVLQKKEDGTVQASYVFAENGKASITTRELSTFMVGIWQGSYSGMTLEQLEAMLKEIQDAKDAAEQAQKNAEEERLKAEKAVLNAQAAQEKAEEAQREAIKAQEAADKAKDDANTDRLAAEQALKEAQEAQKKAQEAQDKAIKAQDEAIKAQGEAKKAQEEAEKAQDNINADKLAAEEALLKAQIAQKEAEKAQEEAEKAKEEANADKLAAEQALKEAQEAQKKAEQAWKEAQKAMEKVQKMLEKAKTYKAGNFKFRILDNTTSVPTVRVVGTTKKNLKTLVIPSTVKINNITCKVTRISTKAFQNQKNLQKVTIGANVKRICMKAFYGDKKLKTIVIRSKSLTRVDDNAFKGIATKATVKVPKNYQKKYKKLLSRKGANLTVK